MRTSVVCGYLPGCAAGGLRRRNLAPGGDHRCSPGRVRARRRRARRDGADETGLVHIEAALVSTALIILLMLVVYAGRTSAMSIHVQSAAAAAARAASLQTTPTRAADTARAVAAANLDLDKVRCASLAVEADTTKLERHGSVTVTVRCAASFTRLAPIAPPGRRQFVARATEPVLRSPGGSPSSGPAPGGRAGPIDLATVRGITVNAEIAGQVEALLAAASADGLRLSGTGYPTRHARSSYAAPTVGQPTTPSIRCRPPGARRRPRGPAPRCTNGVWRSTSPAAPAGSRPVGAGLTSTPLSTACTTWRASRGTGRPPADEDGCSCASHPAGMVRDGRRIAGVPSGTSPSPGSSSRSP